MRIETPLSDRLRRIRFVREVPRSSDPDKKVDSRCEPTATDHCDGDRPRQRGAAFEPVLYYLDGDVRADSPLHQTFYQSKLCS